MPGRPETNRRDEDIPFRSIPLAEGAIGMRTTDDQPAYCIAAQLTAARPICENVILYCVRSKRRHGHLLLAAVKRIMSHVQCAGGVDGVRGARQVLYIVHVLQHA